MVCDNIIYHPVLTRLLKFLESVQGREKILRLLQYLNRILFNSTGNLLYKQLAAQFALSRKLLRFLKPLSSLQTASRMYDMHFSQKTNVIVKKSTTENLINIIKISKVLFFGGYLFLDQITLFKMLNLINLSPKTAQMIVKYTNVCWLYGLTSSMMVSLYDIDFLGHFIGSVCFPKNKSSNKNFSQAKLLTSYKKILSDCLDMYIVLNNLKKLKSDDSNVGLAGLTTSIFGIQEVWSQLKT